MLSWHFFIHQLSPSWHGCPKGVLSQEKSQTAGVAQCWAEWGMQGLCHVPSASLGKAAEVLGASSTLSLECWMLPLEAGCSCAVPVSVIHSFLWVLVLGGSILCFAGEGHGGKVPAHGWEKILFP